MNKVLYIILISLFSLTIISCAKKDDSSSSSSSDNSTSSSGSTDNSTDNSYSGSSVILKISQFVIDTTLEVGTITGGVLSQDNDSDLSGVSVSFEKSGTTVDNTTTDSSGDFSQTLILGTYTITYSKSGYLDETQSVTLAADNQTLVASTLKMLPDSCTSGTISGTIKDAVNNNPVTGVSLSVRRGLNVTSGTIVKTDSTSNTGTYSLSSMSAGWYTVETSKSGYITSTLNVYACGDNSGEIMQDTAISTTLDTGAMRIVLTWKTLDDLDSHLTGPDNLSRQGHLNAAHEKFHLYYHSSFRNFYYATNNSSCSGCSVSQMSDNVTLDMDNFDGIGTCDTCGPETITISAVRSGTYRYYVHNFSSKGTNNLNLAASDASVKVYYNDTVTTFNVPNSAGDLWYVFGFDNSSGFTADNNMGSDGTFTADVFAPKISEVTAVSTPTNDNTSSYTFHSDEAGTITYGVCSGSPDNASAGNNTITFDALADGTHSNCKISVTDNASNTSDNLSVRSFTIGAITPALVEVTPVPTPTNDNTSSYTFISTLSGTISYGGDCDSGNDTAVAGNNTITFNELAERTYNNCKISVTDNLSNTSDNLSVSSFTIDTTAPTLLDNLTIASNNTLYTTMAKTGDNITLSITSSEAIQTPIVLIAGQAATETGDNMTWSATYKMAGSNSEGSVSLNIGFSDLAGNAGSAITSTTNGSAVQFDRTSPTLSEVTAVTTPTSDNTPDYTFSSNEAGTITYGGACGSSSSSSASSGNNNTVTLTQPDNSTA